MGPCMAHGANPLGHTIFAFKDSYSNKSLGLNEWGTGGTLQLGWL